MKNRNRILLFVALSLWIGLSPVLAGTVVDRTPEGVAVGTVFLPDTTPFDTKNLKALACSGPTGERPL